MDGLLIRRDRIREYIFYLFCTLQEQDERQRTIHIYGWREMDTVMNNNPGGLAIPDNQGNLDVCTRTALAKAIGNGFMEKEFVPGEELDFDQTAITQILVNEHKVKQLSQYFLKISV